MSRNQDDRIADMAITKLGEIPIIVHNLNQLAAGGIKTLVVVTGKNGTEIEELVRAPENHELTGLSISFIHLGEEWTGTFAQAVVAGREAFTGQDNFLLTSGVAVFNPDIVSEVSGRSMSLSEGDACRVVVETDVAGMVGITSNFLLIGTRPMDDPERVFQCSSSLGVYSGIATGMYRLTTGVFADLAQLQSRLPHMDAFEQQLQSYACTGRLLQLSTSGRTWFAVENKSSLDYTSKSITSAMGDDGQAFGLVGLPKKVQRGSHGTSSRVLCSVLIDLCWLVPLLRCMSCVAVVLCLVMIDVC